MADRQVTATRKNDEGDITGICNSGEYWSPRSKSEAISDINGKIHSYYVQDSKGRSDVHVVSDSDGPYLRTDPDGRAGNNLDELPDC